MNTQNVNVKTATKERSERYEEKIISELNVLQQQASQNTDLMPWEMPNVKNPAIVHSLFMEMTYLDDLNELYATESTSGDELEAALYEIFRRMTELAAGGTVVYSRDAKPKVDYEIIQYWVKAQRCTREWFGVVGEKAMEHARYRLAITLAIDNSYA